MILIVNIILIALSLSMDAFALAISYGIYSLNIKKMIITAISVGMFHFFMPLLGNIIGISLFEYTIIKPKIVLFIIFLILSIDMLISFFEKKSNLRKLNLLGIIFFSFSVSFDSFSVGLAINYIYDNIILCVSIFCIISALCTFLGFVFGKTINRKIGKYSFLLGSITLFLYSLWILTN